MKSNKTKVVRAVYTYNFEELTTNPYKDVDYSKAVQQISDMEDERILNELTNSIQEKQLDNKTR